MALLIHYFNYINQSANLVLIKIMMITGYIPKKETLYTTFGYIKSDFSILNLISLPKSSVFIHKQKEEYIRNIY